MNTTLIDKLEREAEHLHVIIAASEPWAKQYEKDSDSHMALIKHEAKLERDLRRYFRDLAARVDMYVNWTTYAAKAYQAYDVHATINADSYPNEMSILLVFVEDAITDGMLIGAMAGENIYKTPLGPDAYFESVQNTARKYSSKLVKDISDVTLNYMQKSLEKSIRLGETTDQAKARLNKVINNPKRAGTIARTESVTSYQQGMVAFGKASGAVGKEWQASNGACQICGPLDGLKVPINDNYNSDVGANPPGHPNCRCGQRLIYQNELDNDPTLLDQAE